MTRRWVAAWATAPMGRAPLVGPFDAGFPSGTIRQRVPLMASGGSVRVRISNAYGTQPLQIEAGRVEGAALTFDGDGGVTVPEGGDVVSDAVEGCLNGDVTDVNVEIDLGAATGHPTRGLSGAVSTFRDVDVGAFAWFFTGIDVLCDDDRGVVVAIGDSLTAGGRESWPGVANERLGAPVVNVGIGGNRLLTTSPCFGTGGLERLDRDVLTQAGAHTVVAMWTNDLGMFGATAESVKAISAGVGYEVPFDCFHPTDRGTAADVIAGYTELVARARTAGLRVILGTTPPFKGSFAWAEGRNAARLEVNEWVRAGGVAEGWVDFAAALADPDDTDHLLPAYDRGDHLHPNAAGCRTMGANVDLGLLRA